MRLLAIALTTLAIGAAVFLAAAWLLQRALLFPRPPTPRADVTRAVPGLERLELGKGAPEAWLLPPHGASARYPVLLFAHGNGELIDHWAPEWEEPRSWGVGVVLVEYPGYGRSPGAPSEASIVDALERTYDTVATRDDVRAIVGYGRSLGGAAVAQLASRRALTALVLESALAGVRPIAARMGVPGWLVRDPFDSVAALARFDRPALIVHGTKDGIVPFAHAERLHAALPGSRLASVPCGHNDCPRPWGLLRAFLTDAGVLDLR